MQVSSRGFDAVSVAVDTDGHVHVAAAAPGEQGGGIFYLTNATGAWTELRVSDGLDVSPSIAAGENGLVAIAFERFGRWQCGPYGGCSGRRPQGVFLVAKTAGQWSDPARISASGVGFRPQLRTGRTDLHLLYSTDDGWQYASETSGWESQSLGDLDPAFTVDADGTPRVIAVVTEYAEEVTRRVVHLAPGSSGELQMEVILEESRPHGARYAPLIAPNGDGLVYYSHSDWDGSAWTSERLLLHLRRGSSGWEVERQDIGSDPRLEPFGWQGTLDEAGRLHFLYSVWTDPYDDDPGDPSGDGLWYANDQTGNQPHRVDDSQRNFDVADWVNPITEAIVIGADGRPHVLFTRISEESLGPIGLWYVTGPGH